MDPPSRGPDRIKASAVQKHQTGARKPYETQVSGLFCVRRFIYFTFQVGVGCHNLLIFLKFFFLTFFFSSNFRQFLAVVSAISNAVQINLFSKALRPRHFRRTDNAMSTLIIGNVNLQLKCEFP